MRTSWGRAAAADCRTLAAVATATALLALSAGCTGDGDASPSTTSTEEEAKASFDLSGVDLREIPAGGGVAQSSATVERPDEGLSGVPVLGSDYTEREYLLAGSATTYTGPAAGPVTPGATDNPYVTRVLVRFPSNPDDFSGRVVVEPLNTSNGYDLDALWAMAGPMLEDQGDAWIGVTERASSVESLQSFDPARYADLDLAANDYAWDILRQVGGVVREGGENSPLPDLDVEHLYMGGYSQSGVETATFVSAFHDDTSMTDGSPVYDGYLPAARAGKLSPPVSGDAVVLALELAAMRPVAVPVIDLETQTDVEGFIGQINADTTYSNPGGAAVRRDDADTPEDRFRLFEVAGAPHAPQIPSCDGGSTFPTHYFFRAALANLFTWAEDGVAPQTADRIDLATQDVVSVAANDNNGNALGGVRSPFVDVALSRYEVHSTPGIFCLLAGRETPLPASALRERFPDVDAYMAEFTDSLNATIEAGMLRAEDRNAMVDGTRAKAEASLG